jgi:hypothetical protein
LYYLKKALGPKKRILVGVLTPGIQNPWTFEYQTNFCSVFKCNPWSWILNQFSNGQLA